MLFARDDPASPQRAQWYGKEGGAGPEGSTPSSNYLALPASCFVSDRHISAKNQRRMLACRNDMALLMGRQSTSQIVRRADVDVAIAQFEEVGVPHAATVSLRSFGRHPSPFGLRVACHPKPRRAKGGGAGGIRTLDRALQPYNGLANRRLQPLGHSSISADMPDARASRKRQIQITPRPFRGAVASRAFLANGRYPVSRV